MNCESSPTVLALRKSVRRLLAYVEQQVQQHGGSVGSAVPAAACKVRRARPRIFARRHSYTASRSAGADLTIDGRCR